MAYEKTSVPVLRSQEGIRKLIIKNGGSAVAFISQPPMEGFEAQVGIEGKTYHIRIKAEAKVGAPKNKRRRRSSSPAKEPTEESAKRVWRVMFFHMKSVFEAANSGVMEFRELMLPYIVTSDNRTIADHIIPKLEKAVQMNPERLLPSGRGDHADRPSQE